MKPRGRCPVGLRAFAVGALALGACATTPHTVRTGDLVRVTTARDTVVGRMITTRADTLVVEGAEQGFEALSLAAVRSIEVDRASVRPWARPVDCLIAGTGLTLTGLELAEHGGDAEMIPIALVYAWSGWNCVDTRPQWRPARIGEWRDDR